MATGKRAVRVGDLILRELAFLLLEKVKDPRVKGVTLTGVRLSNDLKQAKVFFSLLGEEQAIERALNGLNSAKGFMKRQIGMRMALRYVPEILFVHDASLKAGSDMERLLEDIRPSDDEDPT
jgi:ribosome-binding factor A